MERAESTPDTVKPLRLMIVDDHALCCAGMAMMFRTVPEVTEVAVATQPEQAMRIAKLLQPNVALVDITMPAHGGFETGRRLLAPSSDCRVLFLDASIRHAHLRYALRLGASGYWTKHATFDQIVTAVCQVAEGRTAFCPAVQDRLVETRVGPRLRPDSDGTPLENLTPRELEVLVHLADGLTLKQCAERMNLSESTADNHKSRLMGKLEVHNVVELIKLASREGLVAW